MQHYCTDPFSRNHVFVHNAISRGKTAFLDKRDIRQSADDLCSSTYPKFEKDHLLCLSKFPLPTVSSA